MVVCLGASSVGAIQVEPFSFSNMISVCTTAHLDYGVFLDGSGVRGILQIYFWNLVGRSFFIREWGSFLQFKSALG